ncbi:hypothetical protein SAMD00019534_074770 [Acytostelium subglobosum LB1]|uniref:hypothetical protein n=1 Tax=Acytostelium subglobosum LB1 TaxID=1410327 RepID=UPI000644DE03|nr:hypothetical protein SAMD00019534_074770 [Acytostelium subglobosum LB1]GAM24302.1 hypothetical protein SAMD00019534_074770 [Acytostelium subglobosum LB1]|eukprot:XP_012752628.1 hypothetical protein SAMD00019534_074770 [Acytostelium subglobosum LB1]
MDLTGIFWFTSPQTISIEAYGYKSYADIYPVSSVKVTAAVPTAGGTLQVISTCFSQIISCNLDSQAIPPKYPLYCNEIPVPPGVGLQKTINCVYKTNTSLLPIIFDYGPAVGPYSFNGNLFVVNGEGFTPSTTVSFSDGTNVLASPVTTHDKATFIVPFNVRIIGTFNISSGGVSAGPYITKQS